MDSKDPRRQQGSEAGGPHGFTEQSEHPQRSRGRQPTKTGWPAQKRPYPSPRASLPSPGSARSSPLGRTGPPHAASSCGRGSRGPCTPAARKTRRDQVSAQRPDLAGGGGRGSALVPCEWERGPDLACAAVAVLAVFHKAVPAARPPHKEPGVRRVGEARAAPLAEKGAQLAPAAAAEHARERVPTGGEGPPSSTLHWSPIPTHLTAPCLLTPQPERPVARSLHRQSPETGSNLRKVTQRARGPRVRRGSGRPKIQARIQTQHCYSRGWNNLSRCFRK